MNPLKKLAELINDLSDIKRYKICTWGWWDWKTRINIHTAIYKIDNQQGPTVYSTGNSTQYSVMTYIGKGSERVNICICITDSH